MVPHHGDVFTQSLERCLPVDFRRPEVGSGLIQQCLSTGKAKWFFVRRRQKSLLLGQVRRGHVQRDPCLAESRVGAMKCRVLPATLHQQGKKPPFRLAM